MGLWGKIGMGMAVIGSMMTTAPQYLYNIVTQGKDEADRSFLEQIIDVITGGGGSPADIPPDVIEVPLEIPEVTIWDNLSAVIIDPLNLILLGIVVIGGAFMIRWFADWYFGRKKKTKRRRA